MMSRALSLGSSDLSRQRRTVNGKCRIRRAHADGVVIMIFASSVDGKAVLPVNLRPRTSRSPRSQVTSWAEAVRAAMPKRNARANGEMRRARAGRISRWVGGPTGRPARFSAPAALAREQERPEALAECAGLRVAQDRIRPGQPRC